MRKFIASTTIAIAAALEAAPAMAAVSAATVSPAVQAGSSDDSPNFYYHA